MIKILPFIFLILLQSCGVKGPPIAPPGSELPSMVQEYKDVFETPNKKTKKKEKDKSQ